MPLLRKEQGGCTIGSYTWKNDGDVVDVDEVTAHALLHAPGGGFEAVNEMPKKATRKPAPAEDPADDGETTDADPADGDPAEGEASAEGDDNS